MNEITSDCCYKEHEDLDIHMHFFAPWSLPHSYTGFTCEFVSANPALPFKRCFLSLSLSSVIRVQVSSYMTKIYNLQSL